MLIRRINFHAGPGTGKSTTACEVFAKIKNKIIHDKMDVQIELIQEYVKSWAWEGHKPRGFDQIYICAKQMRKEEIPLRNGVDLVVSDSPLFLQCCYAKKYDVPCWESLVEITQCFEHIYPSLNIFLERGDRPYVMKGRYETHKKAKEMDIYIKGMLDTHVKDYICLPYSDSEAIENLIMSKIKE